MRQQLNSLPVGCPRGTGDTRSSPRPPWGQWRGGLTARESACVGQPGREPPLEARTPASDMRPPPHRQFCRGTAHRL